MKISVFFVLLVICTPLVAQEKVKNLLGVKSGINQSGFTGNNGYANRTGSDFEIIWETTKANWVRTYQSGLGVSFQGAEKSGHQAFSTPVAYVSYFPLAQVPQQLYGNVKRQFQLTYLWNTIIKEFMAFPNKKVFIKPYLAPGLFATYLLSAKEVIKTSNLVYVDNARTQPVTNSPLMIDETRNVKGGMHRVNFGVIGCVGVAFPFKNSKAFIEGGGSYSLFNVRKSTDEGATHARTVFAKAGYSFFIGTLPWFRHKDD